jgi:hypothetical protein
VVERQIPVESHLPMGCVSSSGKNLRCRRLLRHHEQVVSVQQLWFLLEHSWRTISSQFCRCLHLQCLLCDCAILLVNGFTHTIAEFWLLFHKVELKLQRHSLLSLQIQFHLKPLYAHLYVISIFIINRVHNS